MTGLDLGSVADYPKRPITLAIGGPPTGGTDILARRIGERMAVSLGKKVGIEYILGASGNAAALSVANAAPDGHKILLGTRSATLHRTMYPHFQYDFAQDLRPVAMVARMPIGIFAGPHVVTGSLRQLMAAAREDCSRLRVATLGVGTTDHLISVLLRVSAGIQWQEAPYMEMSRALTDLVDGRSDLLFAQLSGGISHVGAGSVRALAVTSTTRVADLPTVPTISEEGFPLATGDDWFVVFAPFLTPAEIIMKLNHAINRAVSDRMFRVALSKMGYVFPRSANGPEALRTHLKKDIDRWEQIVTDCGIIGFQ